MLLTVEDLVIQFETEDGVLTAVDGLSFQMKEGETLGIVGESGCGKSVTALSVIGLLRSPPARIPQGKILFKGKNLLSLPKEELYRVRGAEIGMIFQEPMTSLNPVYTIGSQIGEVLTIHRAHWSKPQIESRVLELLDWVGISDPKRRIRQYPHELSGGMRQRVMIAMALACEPKLLIADEPTTALDVTIQAQILELIQKLQRETGMSVILITHDLGVVAGMVDRVMVMYAGKPVEKAGVRDLFHKPMHPYTKGLLASIPSKKIGRGRLSAIPGNVPLLSELPTGCRFQDRCELVQDHCRAKDPVLETKTEKHLVSCFEVS